MTSLDLSHDLETIIDELELNANFESSLSDLANWCETVHDETNHLDLNSPLRYMTLEDRDATVQAKIEAVISQQLLELCSDKSSPVFSYPDFKSWDNVGFEPGAGLVPVQDAKVVKCMMRRKSQQRSYYNILFVLQQILQLIEHQSFSTKRNLYYENVTQFRSQADVDRAVTIISSMLSIPRLYLRILSTPKGMVAGDLKLNLANGESLLVQDSANGVTIPQDMDEIETVESEAQFVLVIEKDATYQKLLDDGFFQQLPNSILVTAKGMPDLCTRQFLFALWTKLAIPIFALVDADPSGIEIMLNYRFGSLNTAWTSEPVAVPALKWIGIHPSDFEYLETEEQLLPLTDHDRVKLDSILTRPYVSEESESLLQEIKLMQDLGQKAEIQAFDNLIEVFMEKVASKEWV